VAVSADLGAGSGRSDKPVPASSQAAVETLV